MKWDYLFRRNCSQWIIQTKIHSAAERSSQILSTSSYKTFCRMKPVLLLFAVSLLYSCEAQDPSTVTPVFVQTGKDLFLDVKKPVALEEGGDLTWKLNGSNNIVKLSFDDNKTRIKTYVERAEFVQTHSLLLKNVQKNDSGDYTAQVSGKKDQRVAEYKVTVQDPVSPVNLTVNSRSSDSCNLTVTCSTVDSLISSTFRCDKQTCSQEGGEPSEATTHPASIKVYVEQGFIICNHSNQVSWKLDQKDITSVCAPPAVQISGAIIATGTVMAVLVAVVCTCLFMKYKQKNNEDTDKQKNNGDTIYAVPQDIDPAQTLDPNPPQDASGSSPTSTYCLVEFHTGPVEPAKKSSLPETVYAQVVRPVKPNRRPPNNQHPELGHNT